MRRLPENWAINETYCTERRPSAQENLHREIQSHNAISRCDAREAVCRAAGPFDRGYNALFFRCAGA